VSAAAVDVFAGVRAFAPGHRIRRFVYLEPGGELVPWQASMRGSWPGYEAKCSCGWESHTGGAVRSYVETLVVDHKWGRRAWNEVGPS
jgi:hypothetical protein